MFHVSIWYGQFTSVYPRPSPMVHSQGPHVLLLCHTPVPTLPSALRHLVFSIQWGVEAEAMTFLRTAWLCIFPAGPVPPVWVPKAGFCRWGGRTSPLALQPLSGLVCTAICPKPYATPYKFLKPYLFLFNDTHAKMFSNYPFLRVPSVSCQTPTDTPSITILGLLLSLACSNAMVHPYYHPDLQPCPLCSPSKTTSEES